jgi:hypothetical protein
MINNVVFYGVVKFSNLNAFHFFQYQHITIYPSLCFLLRKHETYFECPISLDYQLDTETLNIPFLKH